MSPPRRAERWRAEAAREIEGRKVLVDRAAAAVVAFAAVVGGRRCPPRRPSAPRRARVLWQFPTLRLFLREELTAEEYFILAKNEESKRKRDEERREGERESEKEGRERARASRSWRLLSESWRLPESSFLARSSFVSQLAKKKTCLRKTRLLKTNLLLPLPLFRVPRQHEAALCARRRAMRGLCGR